MSFCRTTLIERLMSENSQKFDATEQIPVLEEIPHRRGVWNDLSTCIKDNLTEVLMKLEKIEPQIWGKLIVMEQNYRTAKAYLRSQTIAIDGSSDEFDGTRIGLSIFHNNRRSIQTESELKLFQNGVNVQIDEIGNIFMKKLSKQRISVKCMNCPEVLLDEEYKKVFDIRVFKEFLLKEVGSGKPVREKLHNMSMVFVKIVDSSTDSPVDFLKCPLWFIIIHLISIDMTQLVLEEFFKKQVNEKSPFFKKFDSEISSISSPSATSPASNYRSNSYRDSGEDESSASSSSYLPSPCSNSKAFKGGVARRIMQYQQHHHINGLPRTPSEHTITPLMLNKHSRNNSTNLYAIPDVLSKKGRHAPLRPNKIRSHSHGRLSNNPNLSSTNGYSLLNLCDIDQLHNPVYFPSPEDAERRRRHRSRRPILPGPPPPISTPEQTPNERAKKLLRTYSPNLLNGRRPNRSMSVSRLQYRWPSENI